MTDRQYVIPTRPGMGRGLVNHDDRSKNFRAVALTDQTRPRSHTWRRGAAYDQGQTSQCVAYTGKGILNSQTLSRLTPYRLRHAIDPADLYAGAQRADEYAGENYDGTSGLGLLRYLKAQGTITAYHWAFGLDEALIALSWVGPVGIGVQWLEGMEEPDLNDTIHATGDTVGGHEVELTAIDVANQRVTLTNSWGTGWSRIGGRAHLSFTDLGKLLAADGDCFVVSG